jgi:hypothetical protein
MDGCAPTISAPLLLARLLQVTEAQRPFIVRAQPQDALHGPIALQACFFNRSKTEEMLDGVCRHGG